MTKKLMTMVVAVAVAFGAWADKETVGGYTWTYRINGGTAEICNGSGVAISPEPTGAVTIPSTLGGKPVTSIGDYAFSYCSGLTSVTIPDSVTRIGDYAFSDCSGLKSVHITDLAKWCVISFGVFSANPLIYAHNLYLNGEKVTDLVIPDGVTSICGAFDGCSGLTSVTISTSVTNIGDRAFAYCSGLTRVTIPDSVTSIGYEAFAGCSGLTSVTIPNSVTALSTTAFDSCDKLWTAWYRMLANSSAAGGGASGGGSPSVVTTVVQQVESPYALSDHAADRAIASVTVDADCSIDSFVLKDGKVYDCVVRIVNTADYDVKVSLPSGYAYETYKGVKPLTIPANSRNMLSITRVADRTFLVSREELEDVK